MQKIDWENGYCKFSHSLLFRFVGFQALQFLSRKVNQQRIPQKGVKGNGECFEYVGFYTYPKAICTCKLT